MSALQDLRVVVTRAGEQAGALAELLVAQGAVPVVVSLTEIVPDESGVAALAALDPAAFEWLVVTSPNAADAYNRVHQSAPGRVAAVGTVTAAALAAAGIAVTLVPARQRAEGLVEEFPPGPGWVLLVQGVDGESVLADGLTAKGWTVTVVRPYRTAPASTTTADRAAALAADAVLFASGSAARAWVAAIGTDTPPVVVVIGPQTSAAVTHAGLKVSAVATDHSLAGLVAALCRYFTSRP